MRSSRISSALSLTAVAALGLTACASTGSGSSSGAAGSEDKSVSMAITNVFTSLNTDAAEGNSDTNGTVDQLTSRGFYTVTDTFDIRHNEWFGSYGMTEEGEGIKVDYKVNDGQKWSDGNDIDKGDLLLAWANLSGYFNGEGEEGITYFDYAGDTGGLGGANKPTLGEDGRSISFTYPQAFADWEIAYDLTKPAHVVAELAGMDEAKLVEVLETATPGEENADLRKIADAWNTGYNTTTMPENEALLVGNGPYLVSGVTENQDLTLTANPNYQGDVKPKVNEIVLKTIPDAAAQVQALQNGDVNMIAPQASIDTVSQVEGIKSVTTNVQPDQAYDHLDLNMVEGSPFTDENVRKAFLLTIPRQDIVNKLIKPMSDKAVVLNSQLYVSSDGDAYDKTIESNNSSEYPSDNMDANIEKAKELLAGKTPTVRILYNNKNTNRINSYQMIKESAEKAGFKVEDAGSEEWAKLLVTGSEGTYDASIYGWVSSGVGNESLGQIFKTGSSSNFTSYSNATVDAAANEIMKTTDQDKIDTLKMSADAELFKDAYGLPLFQSVAVAAYSDFITGVKPKPGQRPLTWNAEEWDIAE
ncbi:MULTISPECIES: ABC transporter family substrate-binding protein [unclassified Rothia (in: high G+C Gram-positive bacteria)]|uniref:ABC transporter family substrate-binding protein n=1 Tax=unclassified Rothia (in: high G+C Gram-positive bacteria) TaxID=2689056 RepID=UPI001958BD4D|nr:MULTISPECIES: ABC transporter family substrate-binding protein [unclassified Rothia (in: high G+C Gram-positive bacteria)]MBM7052163.1 ABC transporter family substrate-binding protein [Rothia sp. ZJ1223]QRZ61406.1 ABC transporter family substrate-binding protein [Rothia sp. ZJ932]